MKFVLRWLVLATVVVAGLLWLLLAVVSPLDYWDSFNFLLQARRVTDPAYSFVTFDAWRPRGFVGLLSSLDWFSSTVTRQYPTVPGYHVFMALVSVAFVLVWGQVNALLWGSSAALLATFFLLVTDLLHHYATSVLADITTGLFWGLTVLLFLSRPNEKISGPRAVGVGVFGALAGLSKYHFLPLLPVMMGVWLAGDFRNRRKIAAISAIAFLSCIEICFRVFSLNEAGIVGHVGSLWKQVQVAATLKRPPELYLEGLFFMYGPIFWVLAMVALVRTRGNLQLESRGKAMLVSSIALAIITQAITQRELRYLFPLLPVLLGGVAGLVLACWKELPSSARVGWMGLWLIALLYPFNRSLQDLRVSFSAPIYRSIRVESDAYFAYFRLPSLTGKRCSRIDACVYSMKTAQWEYPKDQFYRSYDLGPHYEFFTKLKASFRSCAPNRRFSELSDADTCYVLPFLDMTESQIYPAVIKPLGKGLSEKQMKVLQGLSAHPHEGVHCEEQQCWSVAPFFRQLPREN